MTKTNPVSTPCGDIIGIDAELCNEFRGIKYATASRWEYPTAVTAWDGVLDATEWGACSYQRRGFEDDEVCNAFYHKEFRKGLSFDYSENCLFLNIWAPKQCDNAPVVIYIHGGSFTGGSANEAHINGTEFANNGIIFVAMNYRLGPFGFCSHPDIAQDGACGNFGLYDQLAAIEWVRSNISAFGGDVDNITLIGQSAGAMSVDLLVTSDMCRGYFKGAILMSGAGMQRAMAKPLSPEKTRKFWDSIIANAGATSIEELKNVDEKTLFYAWSDACKNDKLSMLHTLPVVDGRLVTKSSSKMDAIPSDIAYILGITSADMIPIGLELLTKKWSKQAISNGAKCYVYNFFRDLPGDNSGAWHSCDLLYAFNSMKYNWRPYEEIDYTIAHQISSAFYAFARCQDPNCDAIPRWDAGNKTPLRFCENTMMMPWDTKTFWSNTFSNKGAEF